MITIKAEREQYCLATNGEAWTVIERRAGRYYPVGDGSRSGFALDDPDAEALFRDGPSLSKDDAERMLADAASDWRNYLEQMR